MYKIILKIICLSDFSMNIAFIYTLSLNLSTKITLLTFLLEQSIDEFKN